MSRYRKTMSEAMAEMYVGDIRGAITDKQLENLKKVWANKKMSDVTPAVKKMIANMDNPTKAAVSQAGIQFISQLAKEEFEITEGRMKDIYTMDQAGKSHEEIAKTLGVNVKTVKDILGEELEEVLGEAFSQQQIDALAQQYAGLADKRISLASANKLRQIFNKIPDSALPQLYKANIPFISSMASSRLIQKGWTAAKLKQLTNEATEEPVGTVMDKKPEIVKKDKTAVTEKEGDDKDKAKEDVAKKQAEVELLKKKMETEKAKSVDKLTKKQVNPETGEPLLTIGVAQKHLRDKAEKEKEKVDEAVLQGRDYKYDGKTVSISKKNFKQVSKDFKNATPGQERMVVLDPKSQATISAPVKFTEESVIFEGAEISTSKFDSMKKGDTITLTYNSVMSGTTVNKFRVKSKSRSAKYNVDKITMHIDGKPNMSKYYLYKRGGKVSLATGDMAATITQVREGKKEVQYEACWDSHKQVGWKMKGGKRVPNCVPKSEEADMKEVWELEEFTTQQIKQAYGIANDPRYKQGNYSGAVKAIEKLAKGLSKHPDVEKVLKRTNEELDEELLDEMAALRKKADKSGISFGILKKVFDRGMAAWKGGHRPGASQHQWAYARVNSFITKGSGTWGGADKDLAKQARGQKEDLDAVPQDRDVKKKDGTQPKKYYKGLSKDDKEKRADHFKNNDSNKEAPGDKDAKTKPSIHTQKYKKMYGEMAKDDAYAIGMSQAKKHTGDTEPPLEKSTIKKGHEIAKSILKKESSPSITKEGTFKLDEMTVMKEYEPGSVMNNVDRDIKNITQAIKSAGGQIDGAIGRPTRREPNLQIDVKTTNPSAVKAAIKKADPEATVDL
tara:strand:- start:460 stop:2988 length:2529 start_codon:yes stop_codon:yes gene_type:complete